MQKRFLKASTEKHERGSDSFNMEGVDGGGRNTQIQFESCLDP